jgi:hypothetical protein
MKHKLTFVFRDKNFILETDFIEEIAQQDWFREFLGLGGYEEMTEEGGPEELEENEEDFDEEPENEQPSAMAERLTRRFGEYEGIPKDVEYNGLRKSHDDDNQEKPW